MLGGGQLSLFPKEAVRVAATQLKLRSLCLCVSVYLSLSLSLTVAGLVQLFTDRSVSWEQTVSMLNIFR